MEEILPGRILFCKFGGWQLNFGLRPQHSLVFGLFLKGRKAAELKRITMQNMDISDRCRGSLVGGAVGDALGYAVEFMPLAAILGEYGPQGIADYKLDTAGVAEFSDDTQMALFTAECLLCAVAGGCDSPRKILPYIVSAYKDWYYTQFGGPVKKEESWLTHIRALWSPRAPGNTCMTAMNSLCASREVSNNSKGCGGVMRVAPIGIFAAAHPDILSITEAGQLAGDAAEVTHKHLLSTYPSMAAAMIVAECIGSERMDRGTFRSIVTERVLDVMKQQHDDKYLQALKALTVKALDLAATNIPDFDAIRQLGEGWVAEETLAIAVFSVMRYIDDFGKCVCCAVNHDGDSDSTGAVAGNIIGAIVGYHAIPEKYLTNLELHDVLLTVADDLSGTSDARQMEERYVRRQPYNVESSLLI